MSRPNLRSQSKTTKKTGKENQKVKLGKKTDQRTRKRMGIGGKENCNIENWKRELEQGNGKGNWNRELRKGIGKEEWEGKLASELN